MTIEQKLNEIKRLNGLKEEYLNMLDICNYTDLCIIDECNVEIQALKTQLKYEIELIQYDQFDGYVIGYARYNGKRIVNTYIKSRYNGRNTYTLDCTHAKHYRTKQAAARAQQSIIDEINSGII